MKKEDAQQVAQNLLKSSPAGDDVFFQTEGQIMNPHLHSRYDTREPHVDGWRGVKNPSGDVSVQKIHSDDK